ncbi:hypothetical protein [Benzoatithermus flavus]|uniref:Glutamyl-tRNA reductase n=1 Tax=Benzoatithermus flavus TaxID=3108223 RepID=A0ABU8XY25_9PROT
MLELAIDTASMVLLAATSVSCLALHRRLRHLQTDRGDIEAFVRMLDAATQRAEATIAGIREAADDLARHRSEAKQQTAGPARPSGSQAPPHDRSLGQNPRAAVDGMAKHASRAPVASGAVAGPARGSGKDHQEPDHGTAAATGRPTSTIDAGLIRTLETLR